jgi:hypothetical protein
VAHLEPYVSSPQRFSPRSSIPLARLADAAPEWEVEKIIAERTRKRGNRRIPYFRVRYTGFGPESDEWIPKSYLKNAPEILKDWMRIKRGRRSIQSNESVI